MKTKLEMAHEFMMKKMETETIDNHWELFYTSWRYADAMQAAADKREKKEQSEHVFEAVDEWQPDWSQAPADATYWTMRQDGKCLWWKGKPLLDGSCFYDAVGICHTVGYAPSFGYTGDWRNSLRKRPQ